MKHRSLVHAMNRPLFPLCFISYGGRLVSCPHVVHFASNRPRVHVRHGGGFPTSDRFRIEKHLLAFCREQPLTWTGEILARVSLRDARRVPSDFRRSTAAIGLEFQLELSKHIVRDSKENSGKNLQFRKTKEARNFED